MNEPAVSNRDIAAVLAEIAILSELNGVNPYRARAFATAARTLEASDADLAALARDGALTSLPSVGPVIADTIRELVETGRSRLHEELHTSTPLGLFDVLRVPGIGAKRVHTLYTELGVDSLESLEQAAHEGRIARLPGFGPRTQRKIVEGIGFVRDGLHRRRYHEAIDSAERLLEWLRTRPEVKRAELAGGIRRRLEIVDAIDFVVLTTRADVLQKAFAAVNGVTLEPGAEGWIEGRLIDGIIARLCCVEESGWATALLWTTGSPAHLTALRERATDRGMQLNESGIVGPDGQPLAVEEEPTIYEALDLPWIAPELREGLGEVEAAAAGRLGRLVELDDLRGTFHCHTTYSDGRATVVEMAAAARARGWAYLGLADHSRTASYARGLSVDSIREQQAEVDALNKRFAAEAREDADALGWASRFRIFKGIESDILPDGSLDYDPDVLVTFDYVIGSVHSSFGMSEAEMTERVLCAVRNPYLTMLGHPTGRLLLIRSGYPLDVHAILDAAAEHRVVVEINSNPHRLDLDWRHVRYAVERGVLLAVNPDAHSIGGFQDIEFGVNVARKGGLGPRQVLNTWTLAELESYFADRKARIAAGAA